MRPPPPSCSTHGWRQQAHEHDVRTPTLAHTTLLTQCMLQTACMRSMRPLQHSCGSCKRMQCQQSRAARPLTRQHVRSSPARVELSYSLMRADVVPERKRPCRRR